MTLDGQVGYREDLEEKSLQGASPVLIGYDHRSKGVWAMVVDHMGPTDSAVKWVTGKISESGNAGTTVVIRPD